MKRRFIITVLLAMLIGIVALSSAALAATDNANFSRLGIDSAVIQEQSAELEAARLNQIRSALELDFLAKYRVYMRAIATGDPMAAIPFPNWALSSTPADAKANFKYLADNYLPDMNDQIAAISRLTGVSETDFYELEYVPPAAGDVLPSPGHIIIRRLNAPVAVQGRLRGLLSSVTLHNGVVSMRVNSPSTFFGSEALNASLVRNNGLTLDPVLAAEIYSTTGGPDTTFIPGTIVTFAQKGTNSATASAQGMAGSVVFPPTIKFKGKDGEVIGVNLMEMEQAAGDPVSRFLFKKAAVGGASTAETNYIRFEDNRGVVLGLETIYHRDGADGKSGNDLATAIWAHLHLGGDTVILSQGDTVNGEISPRDNVIRFGGTNKARIYLDSATGKLHLESDADIRLKAEKVFIEKDVDIAGTTVMNGAVTMKDGLDMSGTNITNVGNLSAGSANISGATTTGTLSATGQISGGSLHTAGNANIGGTLTLAGKTGDSAANAYNVWVANATYSTYAASAGSATNLAGIGDWDAIKAYIAANSSSIDSLKVRWDKAVSYEGLSITFPSAGLILCNTSGNGSGVIYRMNGVAAFSDNIENLFLIVSKGDVFSSSYYTNSPIYFIPFE